MKAVFINSLTFGGAEGVLSNLISNGYDVNVLITIWPEKFFKTPGIEHISLLNKKGFIIFDLFIALFLFCRLISRLRITSVNSHLFWANYINGFASFFYKQKVICTHCVSINAKYSGYVSYLHKLLFFLLLRGKKIKHIYKSKMMKFEYEKMFNINNGIVIFNPLDTKKMDLLAQSQPEVEVDFNNDAIKFLCVGRFHETKNQLALIKVFYNLDLNVKLYFLGDGPCLLACKEWVKEHSLIDKVFFLGKVANPYPYYKCFDYYVSASGAEGFPNALVEAVYFDCFALHSDCLTGPREILSGFKKFEPISGSVFERSIFDCGLLFKVLDDVEIRKALEFVVETKPKVKNKKVIIDKVEISYIVNQYNSVA